MVAMRTSDIENPALLALRIVTEITIIKHENLFFNKLHLFINRKCW